ncbi:MAG: electron transport complex subunit RsxA [Candidatus Omnitrophica bacterium]|nr:electron transport complex subunit RsxA [Candidatus Omnitrophota bacterium]MCM8793655.1 electron transport complex subunit RsxA [Candidatus Omnitrophota bacterium]
MTQYLMIIIGAIFINNFIFTRFLGLCPFIGVSKETKPALSMGLAVTFVMTMASLITWLIYRFILIPYNLLYLRTISFILVIATFVQLVEIFIHKVSPTLFRAFGIYLPLITTNCAVLGVALLNSEMFFKEKEVLTNSFSFSILQGFSAGLGFTLAILLMSGIRERLEMAEVPQALKNIPIAFIVASLMSIAFLGFVGFKL